MKYFGLFIKKLLRYLLKPLSFLPALCMMYLIYSFSAQPGALSGSLSQKVTTGVVSLADRVLSLDLDATRQALYIQTLHFYIRKAAHITEYFLLAVSVALPLYVYRLRGFKLVLAAGIFCVGFAMLDEYHQSFVVGRSASARDVAIDSIGIFIGIYTTRIAGWLGRKTLFRPLSMSTRSRKTS